MVTCDAVTPGAAEPEPDVAVGDVDDPDVAGVDDDDGFELPQAATTRLVTMSAATNGGVIRR
jgi:hypothetical protein